MKAEDWPNLANDFVTGLESEAKANVKEFYNKNSGSNRAKSAIAKLDALRTRLQPFVRA